MGERLEFARSLYALEAVETAASAYEAFSSISVSAEGDLITADIADPAAHPDLVDAFRNHALFETVLLARK
jgi:hypothetical protein